MHFFTICLDSDEDLRRWNSTAEAQTAALKSKICKWEREKEEIAIRAVVHKDNINKRIQEISKLQTEAEVHALC